MTHEKALISQRSERTERRRRMGMWGDAEKRAEILPEQHASAVSFPILTEADYAPPFCADTFGTDS